MKKRAQIFLIAAAIISVILIGFGVTYNSAKATEADKSVDLIADNLKYEGRKIIEHSYRNNEENLIQERLLDLAEKSAGLNKRTKIMIIFGEKGNLFFYDVFMYDSSTGSVKSIVASGYGNVILTASNPDVIDVEFLRQNYRYTFKVSEGYNFWVLVSREVDRVRTIAAR